MNPDAKPFVPSGSWNFDAPAFIPKAKPAATSNQAPYQPQFQFQYQQQYPQYGAASPNYGSQPYYSGNAFPQPQPQPQPHYNPNSFQVQTQTQPQPQTQTQPQTQSQTQSKPQPQPQSQPTSPSQSPSQSPAQSPAQSPSHLLPKQTQKSTPKTAQPQVAKAKEAKISSPKAKNPPKKKQPQKEGSGSQIPNTPISSPAAPAVPAISSEPEKLNDEDIEKEIEELNLDEASLAELKKEMLAIQEEDSSTKKDCLNIIFIGHVDAGKSTISGQILYLTGVIDKRTIEKYEREAKEKNRGTWFFAYIMDTNEEERAKGKTVEVGRAYFESEKKRYTILDAPGHKNYVPNMIGGAAQADVGILVISARQGEFEAGFVRGGQTREHAVLARTLGIRQLIVVVNKMDEKNWEKERYDDIVEQISNFLKKEVGYPAKDFCFLPISGYTGLNLIEPLPTKICPWYGGKSLIQILDELPAQERNENGPLRIPVFDKYKEMGLTIVFGKVESGTLMVNDSVLLMPNRLILKAQNLWIDERRANIVKAGENIRIGFQGIEDTDIVSGCVISDVTKVIPVCTEFIAQLVIVELLPTNPLFSAGFEAVIHLHSSSKEASISELISEIDKKTRKVIQRRPKFVKQGAMVNAKLQISQPVCIDLFADFPQLGRFTLRDKGKTIAIGKVLKICS